MNLEQLRKRAKERVKERRAAGEAVKLSDVQRELAREHGYRSWPALVAAVEANADAFVVAATSGRRERAERMLAARPEIERDPWARLVLGRGWNGDPSAPAGPRGWAPILYVCHSVFASAELARELLARGADPNATFTNEYGEMPALYGAAGVVHDPELTRVLLEAGADPDDGESLYHATEARSPECLRLLLEHGAETRGTHALPHALDWERSGHVRLLLEHGADPNEWSNLAHAIRRGRGPEVVRLLAEHGADLEHAGDDRITPYRHAVRRGRSDVAETLVELGAAARATADDEALGAIVRNERPAHLPRMSDDAREIIVQAAFDGSLDLVVDLFGTQFGGGVGGGPPGTLLHQVAWAGRPDLTARLLEHGADVGARAPTQYATPLGWCVVGSAYYPPGDHVPTAELLVASGGELEPIFIEIAEGPLLAWLEERL